MYKILFLVGKPLSGKSTLANSLSQFDEFKEILSYTNREPRITGESTHIFKTTEDLVDLMMKNHVVASTKINDKMYFALEEDFDQHIINIYVVDLAGVIDTIDYFQDRAIYMICYISRDITVNNARTSRPISIPFPQSCDFVIDNNFHLDNAINIIKALCFSEENFKDYNYYKDQHFQSFKDKEDEINNKIKKYERYLDEAKKELGVFKCIN